MEISSPVMRQAHDGGVWCSLSTRIPCCGSITKRTATAGLGLVRKLGRHSCLRDTRPMMRTAHSTGRSTALPLRFYTDAATVALKRKSIFDRSCQLSAVAYFSQLRNAEGSHFRDPEPSWPIERAYRMAAGTPGELQAHPYTSIPNIRMQRSAWPNSASTA